MKKLILLLIPLLFLSSCTIDWNDEKDAKIAELEKQIQDDTFKKKQECTGQKDNLNRKVSGQNNNNSSIQYSFIEIFYSKKHNNCLWILEESRNGEDFMGTMKFLISSGGDWISGNIDRCTWYSNFNDSTKDNNDCDVFDERIKELKGE